MIKRERQSLIMWSVNEQTNPIIHTETTLNQPTHRRKKRKEKKNYAWPTSLRILANILGRSVISLLAQKRGSVPRVLAINHITRQYRSSSATINKNNIGNDEQWNQYSLAHHDTILLHLYQRLRRKIPWYNVWTLPAATKDGRDP